MPPQPNRWNHEKGRRDFFGIGVSCVAPAKVFREPRIRAVRTGASYSSETGQERIAPTVPSNAHFARKLQPVRLPRRKTGEIPRWPNPCFEAGNGSAIQTIAR